MQRFLGDLRRPENCAFYQSVANTGIGNVRDHHAAIFLKGVRPVFVIRTPRYLERKSIAPLKFVGVLSATTKERTRSGILRPCKHFVTLTARRSSFPNISILLVYSRRLTCGIPHNPEISHFLHPSSDVSVRRPKCNLSSSLSDGNRD